MMNFALASAFVGALLGMNFSVFALIPAMSGALIIAGATSVFGAGTTIAELLTCLASVQAGYVGAAALRFALRRAVSARSMGLPLAGRAPPQGRSR